MQPPFPPPISQVPSKVLPRQLEIYLPLNYVLVINKQKANKSIL